MMRYKRYQFLAVVLCLGVQAAGDRQVGAQGVIPGTGEHITHIGDDFEDVNWNYEFRLPKSSKNIDEEVRYPGGSSVNGRWAESAKRGQPDVIRRVATPPGGIEGSAGALLFRSRFTGVPGSPSGQGNQDDLLLQIRSRMRGHLPVSWTPSVVVRVFLPPWDQWDNASGTTFGLRADVDGVRRSSGWEEEPYWPGMFIRFAGRARRPEDNKATILIRAAESGYDFQGPSIIETGWWTLGMSFTPDGAIHYYARPGVDDLTVDDHIASRFPYGFKCQHLDTIMFNVANRDTGRWSTPWIIDDPAIYFVRPGTSEATRDDRRGLK